MIIHVFCGRAIGLDTVHETLESVNHPFWCYLHILGFHFLDRIQGRELDKGIKECFPGRREIQTRSQANTELKAWTLTWLGLDSVTVTATESLTAQA